MSRTDGWFARLGGWIALRPWTALWLSLALTVLAALTAQRFRLDPTIEALFPDSPAAQQYRAYLQLFGGAEKLLLVIADEPTAPADPERLADTAEALAARLGEEPEIESARSGISGAEEQFFLTHVLPQSIWLLDDRERDEAGARLTPSGIECRVVELRAALHGPASGFTSRLLQADPLGLSAPIIARRSGSSAALVDPATGAFLARDGRRALVVITPRSTELDPEGGRALLAAIERAMLAAQGDHGAPLVWEAIGGPLYAAHDEAILRQDLKATAGGSIGGVTLILVAGFEGLVLPLVGLVALLAGVIWTGAAITLLLGPISGIGLGFAAMLIGLGDDIVIHGCARYREDVIRQADPIAALRSTFRTLGAPMTGAAATTIVAFAALGLSSLRPVRELGLSIAIGVTLTLLAAALCGGALLRLVGPRLARRSPRAVWRGTERLIDGMTRLGQRRRPLVIGVAIVLTIGALAGLPRLRFESDPRALRPADNPLERTEALVLSEFGLGAETTTLIVSAPSIEGVLDRAARLSDALEPYLPPGAELFSPSDLLIGPEHAASRQSALDRTFGPGRLGSAVATFRGLAAASGLDPAAFVFPDRYVLPPIDAWPPWLRETILAPGEAGDSRAHAALHLRVPLDCWPTGPPEAWVEQVHAADPEALVASIPRVGRELREVATREFRWLGALSALLILGVVLLQFRGELFSLWIGFLPVTLALLWTFGLWAWIGRSLDLISLVVIPVVLGVGVDDGLHIAHAARHALGGGSLTAGTLEPPLVVAAREAGRGILLANLTTIAGFWSLTASHMPGLKSAGALIAIGIGACLINSLVLLPACSGSRPRSAA